jgi:hypothetical protein
MKFVMTDYSLRCAPTGESIMREITIPISDDVIRSLHAGDPVN